MCTYVYHALALLLEYMNKYVAINIYTCYKNISVHFECTSTFPVRRKYVTYLHIHKIIPHIWVVGLNRMDYTVKI